MKPEFHWLSSLPKFAKVTWSSSSSFTDDNKVERDSLRLWQRWFDPYLWRPRGVAVDPWVRNCLVG